jgi:hypothetical protein
LLWLALELAINAPDAYGAPRSDRFIKLHNLRFLFELSAFITGNTGAVGSVSSLFLSKAQIPTYEDVVLLSDSWLRFPGLSGSCESRTSVFAKSAGKRLCSNASAMRGAVSVQRGAA